MNCPVCETWQDVANLGPQMYTCTCGAELLLDEHNGVRSFIGPDEPAPAMGVKATEEALSMMDDYAPDLITRYMTLDRDRKAAEANLKELKEEQAELEKEVAEHFVELGQQSVSRHGRTLYMAREFWPKKKTADLPAALAASPDTAHLVKDTVNNQTLRSWILNDCDRDNLDTPIIPEYLAEALGVAERVRMRVKG